MNDLETRIRDVLQEDASRAPLVPRMPEQVRPRVRRRQAATIFTASLAAVAMVAASVVAIGAFARDRTGPAPVPASQTPSLSPVSDAVGNGWPAGSRNPAGDYSWAGDDTVCAWGRPCIVGSMHKHDGGAEDSVHVYITIERVPEAAIDGDGATATTVAGHAGIYRRIDARREEWVVAIDGTTIAIRLRAKPGTREADLAEAYAIVGSMRTVPRDNDMGFELIFTLTTKHWDSPY